MDSEGRGRGRGRGLWRNLKQRLRFKGIGCFGYSWSLEASRMNLREEDAVEEEHEDPVRAGVSQIPAEINSAPPCVGQPPETNMATAIAAERNLLAGVPTIGPTPLRSLMGLLEETDGEDRKRDKDKGGIDAVCCVCMDRKKGTAFIPCGHTFCRVCSLELWLNRKSCPLCNRPITDILDIFLSEFITKAGLF